ncbi:MAG: class B sortase [Defluviitaleaceae bacterium]|nr:class B sortase [Defluviitaleaceae bacterium]
MKNRNRWLLCAILIAVIVLAGLYFYNEWRYAREAAMRLAEQEVEEPIEYEPPVEYEPEPEPEPEAERVPEPRVMRPEFAALREYYNNDDIIGRLIIPGTTVDYLVVQAEDNEFYLYRDIHGNASSAGWIFLDYDVDLTRDDQNTVIYGHNMNADIKFHSVRHFRNYDFFREHSIIKFNTIYEDTEWEVFAFYVAHISFPYTHINYANEEQWMYMLERFRQVSIHATDIVLTPEDRILTLSTCTNVDQDTRFVLQARLISYCTAIR